MVDENANVIYDYNKCKNVNVNKISRTPNIAAKYKSFKINNSKSYIKVLLDPAFWSEGV